MPVNRDEVHGADQVVDAVWSEVTMDQLREQVQLLFHRDLIDDFIDDFGRFMAFLLFNFLRIKKLSTLVAIVNVVLLIAEHTVLVVILHDWPFGKVDIILLDDMLHSLLEVVGFFHFFLVDLLVALVKMLLLLFTLFLLKLGVD